MTFIIDSVEEQYFLSRPAHHFRQGGRDVYYFTLDMATADGLLPQREDDSLVKGTNRKLTPEHARAIQRYLAEEDEWLLGALMLGIAPDAVDFRPYAPGSDIGLLRIRASLSNTRRIFDGQHRRRAIHDVLAALRQSEVAEDKKRLEQILGASVSIVLYAEEDVATLRQMFVDASKTKPIEPNTVARFNSRDPFNVAALKLSESSKLLRYRVEMERSTAGRTGYNIVSINQLSTILKILLVGFGRRVTHEMNRELMGKIEDLCGKGLEWSDDFLPSCRPEYEGLVAGTIGERETPVLRAKTFSMSVTFLNMLAGCYRLCLEAGSDWRSLAHFIRESEIDVGTGHGLLVDAGLVAPDGRTLFSRRQEVEAASRYVFGAARASFNGQA